MSKLHADNEQRENAESREQEQKRGRAELRKVEVVEVEEGAKWNARRIKSRRCNAEPQVRE